jgi:trans-aconitate methyltransferase
MRLRLQARPVRQDERISKLERDLAKLEAMVEQLVSTMNAEHRMMKESRQEDRLALRDLGEKMERSVASLADEMKRLADRNAAIDTNVLTTQSQALGAIAVARWIVGTALAAGALFLAYQAGESSKPAEPQIQQSSMVAL